MQRRSFFGALTTALATAGLAPKPKPPASPNVLIKRHVGPFVIDSEKHLLISDGGDKYYGFVPPIGLYMAIDLESPSTGDPSKLMAFGIDADGNRIPFAPPPPPR